MAMDRIELLIGMSENQRAENDQWRRDVYKEGAERYQRMLEYKNRLQDEYAAVEQQLERLVGYVPPQQRQVLPPEQPVPRAVAAGPRPVTTKAS
jgi:hypothetical protein